MKAEPVDIPYFNFSQCSFDCAVSSKPEVSAFFGSAIFSLSKRSSTSGKYKWRLTFSDAVDTSKYAVYLNVTVRRTRWSVYTDMEPMTVTAVGSSSPLYSNEFSHSVGIYTNGSAGSYRMSREVVVICDSQNYDIAIPSSEATTSGQYTWITIQAFYTGILHMVS